MAKPRTSTPRSARRTATRHKVAAAAAHLFVEQGYDATTMQAIADEAGVHVQTIYLAFGTKSAVLADAAALLVAGEEDHQSHPRERRWVHQIEQEPDPERQLRLYARHIRDVAPRVIALFDMMRATAGADEDVAAFLERAEAGRRQGPYHLLPRLIDVGALQPGLSLDDAADITYAIASPDTYRALVMHRGWSWKRAENWVGTTLCTLLLGDR